MDDCSGDVNNGTSGGDAKENARSLADAEYGDKSDEERGGNDEDGLHGGLILNFERRNLGVFPALRDGGIIIRFKRFPVFVAILANI